MLLKDFGYGSYKKSIFSRNKAGMENPLDKKFYLVIYFTPLKAFGKYLRTERQVRSGNDAKNAFFTLVKLCSMKKSILRSKFRLFKNFWEFVLGMQKCRKTSSGVRGVVGNHSGPSRMH